MLWVQYEASQVIEPSVVKGILSEIASYVCPYPVAAFDDGEFSICLMIFDLSNSSPVGSSSTEDGNPVLSR